MTYHQNAQNDVSAWTSLCPRAYMYHSHVRVIKQHLHSIVRDSAQPGLLLELIGRDPQARLHTTTLDVHKKIKKTCLKPAVSCFREGEDTQIPILITHRHLGLNRAEPCDKTQHYLPIAQLAESQTRSSPCLPVTCLILIFNNYHLSGGTQTRASLWTALHCMYGHNGSALSKELPAAVTYLST